MGPNGPHLSTTAISDSEIIKLICNFACKEQHMKYTGKEDHRAFVACKMSCASQMIKQTSSSPSWHQNVKYPAAERDEELFSALHQRHRQCLTLTPLTFIPERKTTEEDSHGIRRRKYSDYFLSLPTLLVFLFHVRAGMLSVTS